MVKEGDEIQNGQKLVSLDKAKIDDAETGEIHNNLITAFIKTGQAFYSPVRGKIEKIDYSNGTIIVREIQDYSTKPVTINVAAKLAVPPSQIKKYLKKP